MLTYILGVGDRHLDNLMLAPDGEGMSVRLLLTMPGHFFHVDFGYILGRDPKPYPPPVKVCKEMVDAMGGNTSAHYARFQSLCYTAFVNLRKNSNLILNLVALMVDAGIQDIQLEPDKAVWKVQEKFMLDLPEEDAIKQFEALLSETSYLTTVFDRIHDWYVPASRFCLPFPGHSIFETERRQLAWEAHQQCISVVHLMRERYSVTSAAHGLLSTSAVESAREVLPARSWDTSQNTEAHPTVCKALSTSKRICGEGSAVLSTADVAMVIECMHLGLTQGPILKRMAI